MTARRSSRPAASAATIDAPRATQAARRETAERAILEAAKMIVAERGLDELTLNEAGEAAGYTRAQPAHYFRTKSAMLAALADHIMAGYALCERVGFYIDDGCRDPKSLRAFQAILGAGLTRLGRHCRR